MSVHPSIIIIKQAMEYEKTTVKMPLSSGATTSFRRTGNVKPSSSKVRSARIGHRCEFCGKTFYSSSCVTRFCSKQCNMKAYYETHKKSSQPEPAQSDRLLKSLLPVIFRPEIPTCWPWRTSHTGSGFANKPFIRWPPKATFALSASVSVFRISVGRSLSTRTEEIPRCTLFRTIFIAAPLLLRVSIVRAIVSPARPSFRPERAKSRNPVPPSPNPEYSAPHRWYRPIIFPCRMRFGNTASQQQTSVWN